MTRSRGWSWALAGCGGIAIACSATQEPSLFDDVGGSNSGRGGATLGGGAGDTTTVGTGGGAPSDCAASAKLIYLVSVDRGLHSFDPTVDGMAAYKSIGTLTCPSSGSPQSMSVDRDGKAWVFYDSGQLFHVSTADASCSTTAYQHPVNKSFNQLGMGFTAVEPDSSDQILYILSPDFGLATIDLQSLAVSQKGAFVGTTAELTGGPDALLFMFEGDTSTLGQVNLPSFGLTPLHTFGELTGTMAFAFARYAGTFYMFTSPGNGVPTRTTTFDPTTNQTSVRDADVGFTVVGAGQSTCVPAPPPK